jgi:phage tail tape-measure protein
MSNVQELLVKKVVKTVVKTVVEAECKRQLPKLVGKGLAKRALKGGVVTAAASAVVSQGEHVVELARGRITTEQWRERALTSACGDGLEFAGSAVGGMIGTAVFPGVGTVIGTMAGSKLGGLAGRALGKQVAAHLERA